MSLFLHPLYSDLLHLARDPPNSSDSSSSFMSFIFRRFASSTASAAAAATSPATKCVFLPRLVFGDALLSCKPQIKRLCASHSPFCITGLRVRPSPRHSSTSLLALNQRDALYLGSMTTLSRSQLATSASWQSERRRMERSWGTREARSTESSPRFVPQCCPFDTAQSTHARAVHDPGRRLY